MKQKKGNFFRKQKEELTKIRNTRGSRFLSSDGIPLDSREISCDFFFSKLLKLEDWKVDHKFILRAKKMDTSCVWNFPLFFKKIISRAFATDQPSGTIVDMPSPSDRFYFFLFFPKREIRISGAVLLWSLYREWKKVK